MAKQKRTGVPVKNKKRGASLVGRETSETAKERPFSEKVVETAVQEGLELERPEGTEVAEPNGQKHLQDTHPALAAENPIPPSTVRDGHMLVNYLFPDYEREEDGLMVAMEFSMVLTDDHKGMLPDAVEAAWAYLRESDEKAIKFKDGNIEDQTIELRIAPDEKKAVLKLADVEIKNASLSWIKEKGKGKAKNVIRFKFQVVAGAGDGNRAIRDFADTEIDNQLWMMIGATQGKLK